MRRVRLLMVMAMVVLLGFGEAVIDVCNAAPTDVSEVMKKKKKKKKKKKQGSKKDAEQTTRTVVGYVSQVKEKTPEEIKAEQDSLARVREEFLRTDSVYRAVEVKPEFPGGEMAMYEYISEQLQYPDDAFDMGIEGSVDCAFVVRKDGTITDVEATQGSWPSLKEEAVRIIKTMPNWTPGKQGGVEVSYRHRIRIMFRKTGNLSGY